MAITWTKHWVAGDDGTILRALDLRNIQDDIDNGVGNATSIQGKAVVAPLVGNDGQVLYYDHGNSRFTYKSVVDTTTNQTVAGIKTFSNIMKWSKGADVASTASMTLGDDGNFFDITGTTTITSITAKTAGTIVMFQFDGALTLTDGSNLKLNGNFLTAAESAILLASDGTNWYEISRTSTGGATSGFQVFTASGSYAAPSGVDKILVTVVGAGGGGGGGDSDQGANGYGGGGGAGATIYRHLFKVTAGNSYTVTIGTGGTAGTSGPTGSNGTAGTSSSFAGDTKPTNYTVTAAGGSGGGGAAAGLGAGGAGAAGNTTLNASGASRSSPYAYAGGNGGTPSGGGPGGAGGSTYLTLGSLGNISDGTRSTDVPGVHGTGGGGGAPSTEGVAGNGGNGIVIVEW